MGIAGAVEPTFRFAYRRSADQDDVAMAHHPVVVVGAGPVGLSLAIDLAQRGKNDTSQSVAARRPVQTRPWRTRSMIRFR